MAEGIATVERRPRHHMIRIARQFHWEMGHRLPFHEGGCANIHGHSYTLWVEIEGTVDGHGMLMDYGDLKQIVQPLLEELDHSFACNESDALMADFLRTTPFKVVWFPFHTTAENLVEYLADRVWDRLGTFSAISALTLRLQETSISYAETRRQRS